MIIKIFLAITVVLVLLSVYQFFRRIKWKKKLMKKIKEVTLIFMILLLIVDMSGLLGIMMSLVVDAYLLWRYIVI